MPATLNRLPGDDYAVRFTVDAPVEEAFDAATTVEGLRGWWTPKTSGSSEPGGKLRFGFSGGEDTIMRVAEVIAPRLVRWECLASLIQPEWPGTQITFEFAPAGADRSEVTFRHK